MMRQSVRRLTLAAAIAGVFVPSVPALSAQEKPQGEAMEPIQQDIPDQKLDAAAAAMQQVASQKQAYQEQFDAAPQADKERIANEASAALTKIVTDKGLSIDEYSAIIAMAQNDPVVRGKILDRIRTPQK